MTPLRVLLVEDSVTQREALKRILEEEGDIVVAAEARHGREGVERAEATQPDVVVADVWMPELDGLAMTRALLGRRGVPIIVLSVCFERDGRNLAMECLAAGAVMALAKPEEPTFANLPGLGPDLRRAVRESATIRVRRRREAPAPSEHLPARDENGIDPAPRPELIGIVASTGGPGVLAEILAPLAADYPVPILLVQHISAGFEPSFVAWLASQIALPVRLAADGEAIRPGVSIGPQGRHLTAAADGRLALVPPMNGAFHVPSGDPLFVSLAESFADRALGIILTGMGADGAEGLARLRAAGGRTVAQDQESSLIWGMPSAAIRAGAAPRLMPPERIAALLVALGRAPRKGAVP